MGAIIEQEDKAIEELSSLSTEAKRYLCHHINNELNSIIAGLRLDDRQMIEQAVWHIVADLKRAGIIEI